MGAVLVVDDDPSVLRAFVRALSKHGYAVEPFDSALGAVQRLKEGGVEVIVSDISMPNMTGVELLTAVRKQDPDLPVVLVTGNPDLKTAAQAIEHGAFEYMGKPMSPLDLCRVVDEAVQLHRLARMKREAVGVRGGAAERAGTG